MRWDMHVIIKKKTHEHVIFINNNVINTYNFGGYSHTTVIRNLAMYLYYAFEERKFLIEGLIWNYWFIYICLCHLLSCYILCMSVCVCVWSGGLCTEKLLNWARSFLWWFFVYDNLSDKSDFCTVRFFKKDIHPFN